MVITHPLTGYQLYIGLDVFALLQLPPALELPETCDCDFILAPLSHPRNERVYVHDVLQEPNDSASVN